MKPLVPGASETKEQASDPPSEIGKTMSVGVEGGRELNWPKRICAVPARRCMCQTRWSIAMNRAPNFLSFSILLSHTSISILSPSARRNMKLVVVRAARVAADHARLLEAILGRADLLDFVVLLRRPGGETHFEVDVRDLAGQLRAVNLNADAHHRLRGNLRGRG